LEALQKIKPQNPVVTSPVKSNHKKMKSEIAMTS